MAIELHTTYQSEFLRGHGFRGISARVRGINIKKGDI